MKNNNKLKLLFPLTGLMVFLVAACGPTSIPTTESTTTNPTISSPGTTTHQPTTVSPTVTPTSTPTESPTDPPIVETLKTPSLFINQENGLVTWETIDGADYYSYYINNEVIKTTQSTSIELSSGSTISVRADSSVENYIPSDWSYPITYFETETITEYVKIYFYGSDLTPVSILKGSTYTPKSTSKDYHIFNGWFLDPYFKNALTDDYIFNNNTILYANYIPEEIVNDVTYWIKASPLVSSSVSTPSTSWKYIPLIYDDAESRELGKKIFSTIVTVSGTTSTTYGEYIAVDGLTDHEGRTYFKKGDENFTLKTDGTYKINFSVEYFWDYKGNNVNCFAEQVSSSSNTLENEQTLPPFLFTSSAQLESVNLVLDEHNETVSWNPIDNATEYEYVIDNGSIQKTTSTSVILYKGQSITVRAITNKSGYLPSRWSTPVKQTAPTYPNSIYVFYYGSNRPSEAIPYGSKATKPVNNPIKIGYEFGGWFEDVACTKPFDFEKELYRNTIIYAKFTYIDEVKFSLYSSNKTTKLSDFEISDQMGYNEWKTTFTVNKDLITYVKNLDTNKYYGPYEMSQAGEYIMYFSEDHKWTYGDNGETRNAYWTEDTFTIYFTNNKWWDKVYFYTWDENDNPKVSWPGETMTYDKTNSYNEDIYKVSLTDQYKYIIFSNGSGTQTIDISLEGVKNGTGFYCTDKNSQGKYEVGTYTL